MPNRVISEKIRTSKSIGKLTDFQFRLWTYLLTYVDDFGRGSGDTELLKGFVFPRRNGIREQDIQKGLEALERNGSILLYEVAGEPYFCFPNWGKYQRIQSKISKFPEPSEKDMSRWLTVSHGESPLESNPESNPEYGIQNPKETRAARFVPPTVDEVKTYCEARQNNVDPEQFVDFYESKGWMIGSNKMKDWKAAVRTWERGRNHENEHTANAGAAPTAGGFPKTNRL